VRPALDAWTHRKLSLWPNRHRGRRLRHRRYRAELYDVAADPGETVNLAGERRPIEAALRRRIFAQVDAAGVPQEREAVDAETIDPELRERLRELGYVE
jgi:hypothetical protein